MLECGHFAAFGPMLASISPWHIALLVVFVLLIFGGRKLPELARGLARGLRIFKDEMQGIKTDVENSVQQPPKTSDSKPPEPKEPDKDDRKA